MFDVAYALLSFNRPLGFVAILGILALVGMIARNAVILIEQIESERAQGQDIWSAVVAGAVSRFRPIMLTGISTVLGLIPIAPTVFWGPMAFAVMGGLFVSTLLTLVGCRRSTSPFSAQRSFTRVQPVRSAPESRRRCRRLNFEANFATTSGQAGPVQKEPNAPPNTITATRAISAPTIATITMSK